VAEYTRYLTNDDVKPRQPPVVIPAGQKAYVAVKFPARGQLIDVYVKQIGGTNIAFAVDVLTTKKAFANGPGNYPNATAPALALDKYRIGTSLAGTSGAAATLGAPDDIDLHYRNADGSPSNLEFYLYLLISPTSAGGETTWEGRLTAVASQPG
jgi:hypothetical protein